MPFQSKAQMRYLFAKKPEVAKEFSEKTSNAKKLPEHKKPNAYKAMKKPSA